MTPYPNSPPNSRVAAHLARIRIVRRSATHSAILSLRLHNDRVEEYQLNNRRFTMDIYDDRIEFTPRPEGGYKYINDLRCAIPERGYRLMQKILVGSGDLVGSYDLPYTYDSVTGVITVQFAHPHSQQPTCISEKTECACQSISTEVVAELRGINDQLSRLLATQAQALEVLTELSKVWK